MAFKQTLQKSHASPSKEEEEITIVIATLILPVKTGGC